MDHFNDTFMVILHPFWSFTGLVFTYIEANGQDIHQKNNNCIQICNQIEVSK